MKPHAHRYSEITMQYGTGLCVVCGRPEHVTKEWLSQRLEGTDRIDVIGRALSAIYSRQTSDEQRSSATRLDNGVGFSGPDARIGSIGARMFAAGTLREPKNAWVIEIWMRSAKDGLPRICKYAKQLDQIAHDSDAREAYNGIRPLTEQCKKFHREGFTHGWEGEVTPPNGYY